MTLAQHTYSGRREEYKPSARGQHRTDQRFHTSYCQNTQAFLECGQVWRDHKWAARGERPGELVSDLYPIHSSPSWIGMGSHICPQRSTTTEQSHRFSVPILHPLREVITCPLCEWLDFSEQGREWRQMKASTQW